jgi:Mn-dependent DtxR family transcriptional regulator
MPDESELTEVEQEVVELCRDSDRPFITTMDVADEFQITQQAAYNRLSRLHDDGWIKREKIGSGGNVWWLDDRRHSSLGSAPASC